MVSITMKKRLRLRPDRRAETAARKKYHPGNWKTWTPIMRRKLTEKTSQLADRAYAAKRKMKKAHKQILSEMAAIKESLGRQSIRLRRARSEPERDLALEQTAQLVNEIVLR